MRARLLTIKNPPSSRQRGYATIFTLLLFVAVALVVFSIYDVGQTNTDKVRLQNAADAAAYSGANMMARDFNFMAYTNRAMVANQAAIGQVIGMASWTAQIDKTTENIRRVSNVAAAIPVVGPIVRGAAQVLDQVTDILNRVVERVGAVLISGLDAVNFGLSRAQLGHHGATLATAPNTLSAVLQENDPDARLGLAGNALFWENFFEAWEGYVSHNKHDRGLPRRGERRDFMVERFEEFTEIVNHSTDDFTHERNKRWLDPPTGFLGVRGRMDKRGGNEFEMRDNRARNRLEWNWSAMDTESFWIDHKGCGMLGFSWCGYNEILPVGWGAAHGKDHETFSRRFIYRPSNKWGDAWHNSTSAGLASVQFATNNIRKISGLKGYYDFARDKDPKYNADLEPGDTSDGPSLGVFAHKRASDITTTRTLADKHEGFPDSAALDVEEQGGAASNMIGALSRAELYFKRPSNLWPKRGTREGRYVGKREHGNLYNPYWQVRLTEPTSVQRAVAVARAFGLSNLSFMNN
ncbi:pilus assembly protein TadG-related protein [Vreelandella utahensis]|uniref:pilus assembly protein TadG-related protein n=1 Tax=Vreelandella halophila TaxID=86177 RepID=UPI000985573D|nr:pilus assembly protein TadG-related protein [Halomonas utahensis]